MLIKFLNIFIVLTFFAAFNSGFCQQGFNTPADTAGKDYYSDNFMRYENHIYHPNVKTVLLHGNNWQLAPPVIDLSDPESRIDLHFDVIDSTLGNYMYTVIHCNADWKPSSLDIQEYVVGMPEDFINDYDYSRNTFQRYIHYHIELPSFNIEITKSGNYILKVFDSDTDEIILTRRFYVTESIIQVDASVSPATRVSDRRSKQEIDFVVYQGDYEFTNPYTDLKVVILQNHHWLNAVTDLKPRFVKDDVFDFDYDIENTFFGGNEFRMLDMQNTRTPGQGVDRVTFQNGENHAYVDTDKRRSSMVYLERPDLNGWRFVKTNTGFGDPNVDADYITAHFTFDQGYELSNGDIYIFGGLTDWKLQSDAKMKYDESDGQYKAELYLKQGFYNYIYVYVEDGTYEPNLIEFEGSHFQTENEYAILVYHRQLGWDYDRLLTYKTVRFPEDN